MRACIVNYNTPRLARAAVLSLWKHTPGVRVTVLDNSDRLAIRDSEHWAGLASSPLVEVIDNTKGQIVDWKEFLGRYPDREPSPGNDYGSAKHCYSVQWLSDYVGEPFLLMDSDVLVRRDVTEFFLHPDCAWVGQIGENVKKRFGYDIQKVQPFICFLNVPLLQRHGIRYFNGEYMWNLTSVRPNHRYDTGAWLLRACREAGLQGHELPIGDYIRHLGHGSWRGRPVADFLSLNRQLWC